MSAEPKYTNPVIDGVVELTAEEWEREFDSEARRTLGISAEEFRQRWEAGEYAGMDPDDDSRVWALSFYVGGWAPER